MKVMAYSLYGQDRRYTWGMLRNAELAAELLPDWKVLVYLDETVPKEIVDGLRERNVEIETNVEGLPNKMFWRFLVNDRPGVERYLIRDADSRFSQREKWAVEEWLASGKRFHVIRDHPHHAVPMMAGLWGGTSGVLPMKTMMAACSLNGTEYAVDQSFLAQKVWPIIRDDCVAHDSCTRHIFTESRPFPSKGWRFCGEVFDERNLPRANDWQMRANHLYA